MGLLDFKNDAGGNRRRCIPLLDSILLYFLVFTDLGGFIRFRLDWLVYSDVRMYESAASTESFFYLSASFIEEVHVSPEGSSPFHQTHVYAVLAV